jgi:hypothetical protein
MDTRLADLNSHRDHALVHDLHLNIAGHLGIRN